MTDIKTGCSSSCKSQAYHLAALRGRELQEFPGVKSHQGEVETQIFHPPEGGEQTTERLGVKGEALLSAVLRCFKL